MATTRTKPRRAQNTSERVLDSAERLVQTRGFNGFSYADIAAELGVTKASLHYHFSGKAELGYALIERYSERFSAALERIDAEQPDVPAKLGAYAALYADVLRGKRMCMCGILAAEYPTLPAPMRDAVLRFFDTNHRWLGGVLAEGRKEGSLTFDGSPDEVAQSIVSTLEGAMLVARSYGEVARFEATAHQLLSRLSG
jgi:TetR/AcrR family transcriptional regulator, transcriptional repressor for nem operon